MPPAAPPPPYQPAPVGQKYNVLAIISLVTSIVGISLAGIICGHIALSQIKRTGESGRGMAIAGTIIGYVGLVASIIAGIAFFAYFSTLDLNNLPSRY
jgi:peptidyl-prolyl cis-trans isomerase B (cyclophilin B)